MAATTIDFVLTGLEQEAQMDLSGAIGPGVAPDVLVTDALAVLTMTVAQAKATFYVHSDSEDLTDVAADDLKFYSDNAGTFWTTTNPADAILDMSAIYQAAPEGVKTVAHDFIRHLAKSLFGTHFGVDLFTNEEALVSEVQAICNGTDGAWKAINDVFAGAASPMDYSASDSSNLCCVLYQQILNVAKSRLSALELLDGSTAEDNLYSLPFIENDSISFKLTLKSASGQGDIVGSATDPADRSYRIKINIVA
jgi:hypothetical protein